MLQPHNFNAPAPDFQAPRVEFALWCAKVIGPVFRCVRNGKQPIKTGWQKEATTDVAMIREWFDRPNPLNIGIATGGASCIIVVDLDRKGGKDGGKALAALAEAHGTSLASCKTLTVATPSGGLHLFYRVPADVAAMTGNVGVLGEGIDIRGAGNLVVGAGSKIDGKSYSINGSGAPIADMPQWLIDAFLASKAKADRRKAPEGLELDTPPAAAIAARYLAHDAPPAVEGSGGDSTTVKVAMRVRDFGISQAVALDLMAEHYNPRCIGPWELEDLAVKVANAYAYAQNTIGADAIEAHFDKLPDDDTAAIAALADWAANDNFDDLEAAISKALDAQSGILRIDGLTVRIGAHVKPKNVEWLWPGHFAIGKIGGLAGYQGIGKSQIMCNAIAAITAGGKFPDGAQAPKGKCIVLMAEDDAEDTVVPRLMAAGADMKNVYLLSAEVTVKGKTKIFNLADDLHRIEALMQHDPEINSVFIDPVSSYMGSSSKTDTYKVSDVRAVLHPLGELAKRRRVAVIFSTHFNKGSKGSAINRVTDSAAYTQIARTFWLVIQARDKDGKEIDGQGVFLDGKRNITKMQSGLTYAIEDATVHDEDGNPVETSRIVWSGTTAIRPDEALGEYKPRKPSPEIKAAVSFLDDLLAHGPVAVDEIKDAATAHGHMWRTIERAKAELGAEASKKGARWYWEMLVGEWPQEAA